MAPKVLFVLQTEESVPLGSRIYFFGLEKEFLVKSLETKE